MKKLEENFLYEVSLLGENLYKLIPEDSALRPLATFLVDTTLITDKDHEIQRLAALTLGITENEVYDEIISLKEIVQKKFIFPPNTTWIKTPILDLPKTGTLFVFRLTEGYFIINTKHEIELAIGEIVNPLIFSNYFDAETYEVTSRSNSLTYHGISIKYYLDKISKHKKKRNK